MIQGYRQLNEHELNLIDKIKSYGRDIDALLSMLTSHPTEPEGRSLSLAKTNLQQGFMWLTRAVAKPEGF